MDVWKQMIKFYIEGDEKKVYKINEDNCFGWIYSIVHNMKIFQIDKNKIYELYNYFIKNYKISDENKKFVEDYIEN